MTKYCEWCGKELPKKKTRFCSGKCQQAHIRHDGTDMNYCIEWTKTFNKSHNMLLKAAENAQIAGMTYGKYMAQLNEERKEK